VQTKSQQQLLATKPLAGEEVDVVNDFLNEQLREIDDDMVVRSQSKANDLRLLRRAFIGYSRSGVAGSDESKRRDLFNRMLRRKGK
jgi:hypothetical protein